MRDHGALDGQTEGVLHDKRKCLAELINAEAVMRPIVSDMA
jgi:hypothetical protein